MAQIIRRVTKIAIIAILTCVSFLLLSCSIWYFNDIAFNQKRIGRTNCYMQLCDVTFETYVVQKKSFFQHKWDYLLVQDDVGEAKYDIDGNIIALAPNLRDTTVYYLKKNGGVYDVHKFSSTTALNKYFSDTDFVFCELGTLVWKTKAYRSTQWQ